MEELRIDILTHVDDLPPLPGKNFFQSAELMAIYEGSPRMNPYMAVAKDDKGSVVANMLAIVRYRNTWFPPFFYTNCVIMGNGDYANDIDSREHVFGLMLKALTEKIQSRVLFIEVENLSSKMFAYKEFRNLKFFPVHWMSIHNSIHSRTPEERITEKAMRHIEHAQRRGAVTTKATTEEDFEAVGNLLHRHNIMKPKRYMPDKKFFHLLLKSDNAEALITRSRNKVIGCSVTVLSEGDAYLWYAAFKRKSFALLHPNFTTIWGVLKSAQANGYAHVHFLDVGLPFRKNPFREFILRFGGKPVSTYRWFRCSLRGINSLLSWIYRN